MKKITPIAFRQRAHSDDSLFQLLIIALTPVSLLESKSRFEIVKQLAETENWKRTLKTNIITSMILGAGIKQRRVEDIAFVKRSSSLPGFRVTTSHFSGVVMIMDVSIISALVSCMSPVSSLTIILKGASFFENVAAISAARAFIGAT